MRKFAYFLALALALSCAPQARPIGEKTVNFVVSGVQSGPLTKAVSDALEATASPTTGAELVIQSKTVTARTYTGIVGTPVTLAYDAYEVYGSYAPESFGTQFYSTVYKIPCYSLSGDVEVTEADENYPLTASYTCFAVVVDFTKVSKVEMSSRADMLSEFTTFTRSGDYGIVYLKMANYTASTPFRVRVTALDASTHESAEYALSKSGTSGTIKVEAGKWYLFNPTAVETTSGDFSVSLPGFDEGATE